MGQRPFDSSATRVTSKDETETDTFELSEHTSYVQLGTSSSPVTARMGTGIAIGGVAGTAAGKTYVQFIKAGVTPRMTLKRIGDSNAVASCPFALAATASASGNPTYLQALTSGRTFKGSPPKSKEEQTNDLDLASLAEELDATGGLKSCDAVPFQRMVDEAKPQAKAKLQLVNVSWFLVLVSAFVLSISSVVSIADVVDQAIDLTCQKFEPAFKGEVINGLPEIARHAMALRYGAEMENEPLEKEELTKLRDINAEEIAWFVGGDILAESLIDSALNLLGVDVPESEKYDASQIDTLAFKCLHHEVLPIERIDTPSSHDQESTIQKLALESLQPLSLEVLQKIADGQGSGKTFSHVQKLLRSMTVDDIHTAITGVNEAPKVTTPPPKVGAGIDDDVIEATLDNTKRTLLAQGVTKAEFKDMLDGNGDGAAFDHLQYALSICQNDDVEQIGKELPDTKPASEAKVEVASITSAFEPTSSEEALAASSFDERVRARAWAVTQIRNGQVGSHDLAIEVIAGLRQQAEAVGDNRYIHFDDKKELERKAREASRKSNKKGPRTT